MHIVLQHFAVVTLVILMAFIITSFTLSEHGNAVPGLVRIDTLAKVAALTPLKKRILLNRYRNFMNRGLTYRSNNGLVSVKRKSIMQAGVRVAAALIETNSGNATDPRAFCAAAGRVAVQVQSDGVRDAIRLSRFA
jgi:hypothetical protein